MRKLFTAMLLSIFSVSMFAQLDGVNLAHLKPVKASSGTPSSAVDGNYGTRWESAFSDNQWISIDLGSRYVIDTILIFWEAKVTSAKQGFIQGSYDGNYWWNIIELKATDDDKIDTLLVNDITRFIKIKGIQRNGPYGYSPWEIEVYGTEEITALYVDSISVTPDISALDFGETQQFSVAGFDQNNAPIALSGIEYSVDNAGQINSYGLFTANKVGDFKITVVSNKISDTAIVSVTSISPIPTSVIVTPAQDTLTEGETTQFSAVVYDQNSNPMSADITWSTKFNTISQSGLFTGKYTGDNTIIATVNYTFGEVSGSISDTALVSVYPTSTQNIALNYVSAAAGSEQQSAGFAVDNNKDSRWESASDSKDMSWTLKLDKAYDLGAISIEWEFAGAQSYNIQISNDSLLWTTIYMFNPNNITRTTPSHSIDSLPISGNAQFVRFVGLTRTSPWGPSFYEFRIYPAANSIVAATRIEVEPKTATIDEGEELQLNFTAYNSRKEIVDINPSWAVLNSNATITANGIFSSVISGEYQVVVAFGNIADTAIITVEDISVLEEIEIYPADVDIAEGSQQQFTAVGFDQFDIEFGFTPAWSVTGGGSIDNNGLFTATEIGDFYVKAEGNGIADSVLFTVTELPVLDSISVSPENNEIQVGQNIQFSVVGFDQFGNSFEMVAPEWTVNGGGTISSGGLFSASEVGTFYVKATEESISDSVSVVIEAAPILETIEISPADETIQLGETQQFTAAGTDQYGDPIEVDVTWSVSGDASISETGLFSTSAKGEYTVTAEQGDVSASATITVEGDNATENLSLASVKIYPNPAFDFVTIELGTESYNQIEIVTASGAKIYANDISAVSGIFTVDLKSFEPGIYCVRLINDTKIESLVITKN